MFILCWSLFSSGSHHTFRLIHQDGTILCEVTLRRSQLTPPPSGQSALNVPVIKKKTIFTCQRLQSVDSQSVHSRLTIRNTSMSFMSRRAFLPYRSWLGRCRSCVYIHRWRQKQLRSETEKTEHSAGDQRRSVAAAHRRHGLPRGSHSRPSIALRGGYLQRAFAQRCAAPIGRLCSRPSRQNAEAGTPPMVAITLGLS